MSPITILIVDDHAMVRKGLRLALESQPDLKVVGEAGNVNEAMDAAGKTKPQIITLDLTMPGASGVSAIGKIRTMVPQARIIVVSMHDDPAYVRSAIAIGASGYVNKSAADTELISAIRAVAKGRVFVDVGDAATLESILSSPTPSSAGKSPVDTLSEREREVLQQVAKGYTNQQIADDIGLSVKTVESYRARLMKKLGLKERADLVRLALEMGLLEK
ncbi:MAG: response regulator transcription factor [Phycisphaerales bacterium]|nr:MAG: response regulator transcription factor [Phycisphaerales bacterium]